MRLNIRLGTIVSIIVCLLVNRVAIGAEIKWEGAKSKKIVSQAVMSPQWSNGGKKFIAFCENYRGFILVDTNEMKTDTSFVDEKVGFGARLSKDGEEVVFRTKDKNSNILVGLNLRDKSRTEYIRSTQLVALPALWGNSEVVSMSDGILKRWARGGATERNMWAWTSKGKSNPSMLGNIRGSVQPAGEKVAYAIAVDGAERYSVLVCDEGLILVNLADGNVRQIASNSQNSFAIDPKFSPDGTKIMYYNNVGRDGHVYVYCINENSTIDIGLGYCSRWINSERLIFSRPLEVSKGRYMGDIFSAKWNATEQVNLTSTIDISEGDFDYESVGNNIVCIDNINNGVLLGKMR